jgi:hypothetical protein
MNKKNEDEEFFYDFDYAYQFKKVLAKFMKLNSTITQLSNKDVIIRETKTYETIYFWDNKLKKFTIKSKKIV